MLRPASAYRELARADRGRASLLRKPLLLAFLLGCGVSAFASGRFTVRLIADGAVSFAFIPAFVIAAFAVVRRSGTRRRIPFARAVDLFFTGNGPWLLWIVASAAVVSTVAPRQLGPWVLPLELSLIVPIAWSAYIDFHFFREVMDRSPHGAVRDVALHRAIGWLGIIVYFLGIAILSMIPPDLTAWVDR